MSITPPASIHSSASPRPSTPSEAPNSSNHIALARCANLVIIPNTPKVISDRESTGRGVFTNAFISRGSVIDVCPVLLLGLEENVKHIEHTSLYHYTYNWPTTDEHRNKKVAQAIVFGLGSMFNHSAQSQNVGWERDAERGIVTYRALRDIESGEELCISYGSRLTFQDADAPVYEASEGDEVDQLYRIQIE